MNKITFGIIGGGWRADFFLKIAQELPDRFRVSAMMVRNAEKGAEIEQRWNVPTYRTFDETLAAANDAQFMVVSVPWAPAPGLSACAGRTRHARTVRNATRTRSAWFDQAG